MAKSTAVVIIPTYNEKENISELIPVLQKVFQTATNWDLHVLVVDDSSPDGTGETVKQLASKQKNVHLLSKEEKKGLGAAYLAGMKYAFSELEADVVFEMDADFSHDPQKIPEFLVAIEKGADMVLGSRYIPGGSIPADWGLSRKLLSVVGNVVNMVIFTHFSIRDWTGGYRAITKKVFKAVIDEMDKEVFSGYTFQIGFLHKTLRKGFKIREIPIHFVDRKIGQSKLGPEYIKNTLFYILTARFVEIVTNRKFKFALVGGTGFIVTAVGSFIFEHLPVTPLIANWLFEKTSLFFLNADFVSVALATECAIVSNFILNNFFTFKDTNVITIRNVIPKFLQFNTGSLGALIINSSIVGAGTSFTGSTVISKLFWLVVGTLIAMVVNYTIYSKLIWKKTK